jgi:hypothetical protein
MKRDSIKFTRAKDKKTLRLKSYEDVDLSDEKMAKEGVVEIQVKMDGMEGHNLIFSTVGENGKLAFENKKPKKKGKLWQGYTVEWERKLGDEKMTPLVIEMK